MSRSMSEVLSDHLKPRAAGRLEEDLERNYSGSLRQFGSRSSRYD